MDRQKAPHRLTGNDGAKVKEVFKDIRTRFTLRSPYAGSRQRKFIGVAKEKSPLITCSERVDQGEVGACET